jgi:predicted permease
LFLTPLQERITEYVRPALRAVITATVLLLIIAAINVVILTLARGAERRMELSTCAAFGASRGRLVTPVLAEGIILAIVGGGLGVALAYAGVGLLTSLDGVRLPRLAAIQVDRSALLFAGTLSIGIGCAAAAVPALGIWRGSGAPLTGIRVVGGHQRLRRAFVVVEVALALVLLIGAGLLVRTVQRLMAVPLGFHPGGVLSLQIQTGGPRFRDAESTRRYFDQVRTALQGVTGVADAALTSQLPLSGDAEVYGVTTADDLPLPEGASPSAFRYAVSPAYFSAMGIPVIEGRAIEEGDRSGALPVAVISASLAASRFGGRPALGRQLHVGPPSDPWLTVVGIVGNVRQESLANAPGDALYEAASQRRTPVRTMWVVAHTVGDPAALAPSVRRVLRDIDADQPIIRVATMDERMVAATGRQRFVMTAFEAFALVALLLATIGIYGVLAVGVAERTREIAVRAAVGASGIRVMALVLRQAAVVVASGMAIGGLASAAIGRTLASLLFEVSPLDAVTYAGVVGVLVLAAAAGGFVPAWRASRIAPATALQWW